MTKLSSVCDPLTLSAFLYDALHSTLQVVVYESEFSVYVCTHEVDVCKQRRPSYSVNNGTSYKETKQWRLTAKIPQMQLSCVPSQGPFIARWTSH